MVFFKILVKGELCFQVSEILQDTVLRKYFTDSLGNEKGLIWRGRSNQRKPRSCSQGGTGGWGGWEGKDQINENTGSSWGISTEGPRNDGEHTFSSGLQGL